MTPWNVAHQAPLHGFLQARILEWVAISSSKGSSHLGIELGSLALQADSLSTEPPGKPYVNCTSIKLEEEGGEKKKTRKIQYLHKGMPVRVSYFSTTTMGAYVEGAKLMRESNCQCQPLSPLKLAFENQGEILNSYKY